MYCIISNQQNYHCFNITNNFQRLKRKTKSKYNDKRRILLKIIACPSTLNSIEHQYSNSKFII